MEKQTIDWVNDHLVCEFDHWDEVIIGLVRVGDELMWCEPAHETGSYNILPIDWDDECQQYLDDYRKAYPHWFPVDGIRPEYTGWDVSSFSVKWPQNPIKGKVNRA